MRSSGIVLSLVVHLAANDGPVKDASNQEGPIQVEGEERDQQGIESPHAVLPLPRDSGALGHVKQGRSNDHLPRERDGKQKVVAGRQRLSKSRPRARPGLSGMRMREREVIKLLCTRVVELPTQAATGLTCMTSPSVFVCRPLVRPCCLQILMVLAPWFVWGFKRDRVTSALSSVVFLKQFK